MNDGVKYYTPAVLYYDFGFPEDKTVCQWCPFCYSDGDLKRYVCRITRELLPHPFTQRGMKCPVTIIEKEERNEQTENVSPVESG